MLSVVLLEPSAWHQDNRSNTVAPRQQRPPPPFVAFVNIGSGKKVRIVLFAKCVPKASPRFKNKHTQPTTTQRSTN